MSEASALERQMLELINAERAANGLDPVQLELRLNDSAEDHSTWMLNQDVFSHTGEGGSSAGDRIEDAGFVLSGNWRWSENIAWQSERGDPGLEDDVVDLHNSLMNSPGHRANILDPNVTVIGIGIELGEFDGYTAVMVTQNFARTSADLQLDNGTTSNAPPATEDPIPTQGDDVIALDSPALIRLLRGNDFATGSAGDDSVFGGNGDDEIIGGQGDDDLNGGRGRDDLSGDSGADTLRGQGGRDTLDGAEGEDLLIGGKGWDFLDGGTEDDRLFGGRGKDTLDGGAGDDRLAGGRGSDTFVFSEGTDKVHGFNFEGVADQVDLSTASGISDFDDLIANHLETRNGNLRITDDNDNVLVLLQTDLNEIESSTFLF